MSADWKSIAKKVADIAPNLGALLGGPVGAGVGVASKLISMALGCDNTPDAVEQALAVNPDAAVKLREIEKDEKLGIAQLAQQLQVAQIASDTSVIQAVNTTMQEEAKAGKLAAWREFCGFVVGINSIMGTAAACLLFWRALNVSPEAIGVAVSQIPLLAGAIAAITAIPGAAVGIVVWHQGKAGVVTASQAGQGDTQK